MARIHSEGWGHKCMDCGDVSWGEACDRCHRRNGGYSRMEPAYLVTITLTSDKALDTPDSQQQKA